jgi:hypothetical protein
MKTDEKALLGNLEANLELKTNFSDDTVRGVISS